MSSKPNESPGPDETIDSFLDGRVRLIQPVKGNRASIDAVLLAACIPAQLGERIADLGAGSGIAGLCVAARVGSLSCLMIDADPVMTNLSARNLDLNQVSGEAVPHDVVGKAPDRQAIGLDDGSIDHVLANPPFHDPSKSRSSPVTSRARAFHEANASLDDWLRTATALVRDGGTITLIHKVDAISEILTAFGTRAGALSIRFVHARPDGDAIRVLVQGTKGSKGPLTVLSPLVLHADAGSNYSTKADAILRGRADLVTR